MHELQHRKGSNTRDRILDVAEAAILEKGADGITKNGFFYHFKDKSELAKALLVRYVAREDTLFDDLFRRADELDEDPLHGFLVGLKMMSEVHGRSPGRPSGLPCRRLLLSGPPIRQGGAGSLHVGYAGLAATISRTREFIRAGFLGT
jgi:AcrR family transcriptional regulator